MSLDSNKSVQLAVVLVALLRVEDVAHFRQIFAAPSSFRLSTPDAYFGLDLGAECTLALGDLSSGQGDRPADTLTVRTALTAAAQFGHDDPGTADAVVATLTRR